MSPRHLRGHLPSPIFPDDRGAGKKKNILEHIFWKTDHRPSAILIVFWAALNSLPMLNGIPAKMSPRKPPSPPPLEFLYIPVYFLLLLQLLVSVADYTTRWLIVVSLLLALSSGALLLIHLQCLLLFPGVFSNEDRTKGKNSLLTERERPPSTPCTCL